MSELSERLRYPVCTNTELICAQAADALDAKDKKIQAAMALLQEHGIHLDSSNAFGPGDCWCKPMVHSYEDDQ